MAGFALTRRERTSVVAARVRTDYAGPRDTCLVRILLGPGRHYPIHPGIGNQLAHVLVRVNEDAQINAVNGPGPAGNPDPTLHVAGFHVPACGFDRLERAL